MMTEGEIQTIRDDFARYTDVIGLLTEHRDQPQRSSGNGILFTAEKLLCFKLLKMVTYSDFEDYYRSIAHCRVLSGLFQRAPGDNDQQAWDDLIGLAAMLPEAAKEILEYGERPVGDLGLSFFYNNRNPGSLYEPNGIDVNWRAWLGRNPAFVAHLYFCCDREPPLYARAAWVTNLLLAGKDQDQDPWVLNRFLIEGNRKPRPIERWAARVWWSRFRKAYPGGMSTLFMRYFANPGHPLAVHWPKE